MKNQKQSLLELIENSDQYMENGKARELVIEEMEQKKETPWITGIIFLLYSVVVFVLQIKVFHFPTPLYLGIIIIGFFNIVLKQDRRKKEYTISTQYISGIVKNKQIEKRQWKKIYSIVVSLNERDYDIQCDKKHFENVEISDNVWCYIVNNSVVLHKAEEKV